MNIALQAECRCGHSRDLHSHFRPGSDCGSCGFAACSRFKPARRLGRWHPTELFRVGGSHRIKLFDVDRSPLDV